MNRLLTGGIAALLLLTAAAPATKPVPPFSATGALSATGQTNGKSAKFATDVRVLHRSNLWRIDILKVTATSDDPNGAMMAQMLPKGAITAAVDQSKNTLTVWTAGKPRYFQTKINFAQMTKTKPGASSTSPWANVMNTLSSMTQYDVFSQSIALTGHQTVNGRMASVFHAVLQMQKHGGKLEDITGDLALADDLSGIPVHFAVNATGETAGAMQIDLSEISTTAPALDDFFPPHGYKKSAQITDVLFAP